MSQPFTAWQLSPVNNIAIDYECFGWTDFGAMVNWQKSLESGAQVDLKFALINGLDSSDVTLDGNTVQLDPGTGMTPTVTPRDGLFMNRPHKKFRLGDGNDNMAKVGKFSYRFANQPLDVGLSWYQGKWDESEENDLSIKGAHLNYLKKNFSLKGEYVVADVEEEAGLLTTTAPGPVAINTTTGDYQMKAWYIEAAKVLYRYGPSSEKYIKAVARLDDVDTNDKAIFIPFDRSRVTLGAEWEFAKNIRTRYEWQKSRIDDFHNAPGPYIAAGGEQDVTMHMASIIASF